MNVQSLRYYRRLRKLFEKRLYESDGQIPIRELSGWDKPITTGIFKNIAIEFSAQQLERYYFDYEQPNTTLCMIKKRITNLLAKIENYDLLLEKQVQLAFGGTGAIALLVHLARKRGIETIILDPPFYFSIKSLAKSMKMESISVNHTLQSLKNPAPLIDKIQQYRNRPKMIYITHPRYVVGGEYPKGYVEEIFQLIGDNDIVVLDRSIDLDQSPTPGPFLARHPSLFVIRTLGKSLSAYGCRLAAIICVDSARQELNKISEWTIGGMDIGMIELANHMITDHIRTNSQVNAVKNIVKKSYNYLNSKNIQAGNLLEIPKPEGTYLGYCLIDTSKVGRIALHDFFLRKRINALFSGDLGIIPGSNTELVRINYLLENQHAINATLHFMSTVR